jgi:nicotinamidase-related amidase
MLSSASEGKALDERLSTEIKGRSSILQGDLKDGHQDQNSDNEVANSVPSIEAARQKARGEVMILQPIQDQLTPNNCTLILMDYQAQYASTNSSTDRDVLMHNAINLAKTARTFNIPTVLTTIGESSFGGPIFSGLQKIFPDQRPIDRTTLSLFDDTRVPTTMEKIGRNKLVIAGLWTDFGVASSLRQARRLGYEGFMVVDACGDVSLRAHQIAVQRLLHEGVWPVTWLQMLLALHHAWAPPEAYEVLLAIARDHASAYGLEIPYGRNGLGEGKTTKINDKPKERWWGKWSMVPIRSLRKF